VFLLLLTVDSAADLLQNFILGAFAKLRKATISFSYLPACLPACLPVRPSEWDNSAPTGWILYLSIFRKSVKEIQV
jgi:hypothetical protein